MGTSWTDAGLWRSEVEQNQVTVDAFQTPEINHQMSSRERGRGCIQFVENGFVLGVVVIVAIFISAIYLVCHYLL
jgi:hypothetical protein